MSWHIALLEDAPLKVDVAQFDVIADINHHIIYQCTSALVQRKNKETLHIRGWRELDRDTISVLGSHLESSTFFFEYPHGRIYFFQL